MSFTLPSLATPDDDQKPSDPIRVAAAWATRFITAALVGAMLFHVVQAKLAPPEPTPVADEEPTAETSDPAPPTVTP